MSKRFFAKYGNDCVFRVKEHFCVVKHHLVVDVVFVPRGYYYGVARGYRLGRKFRGFDCLPLPFRGFAVRVVVDDFGFFLFEFFPDFEGGGFSKVVYVSFVGYA